MAPSRILLAAAAVVATAATPAAAESRPSGVWDCFVEGVSAPPGEPGRADTYSARVVTYGVFVSESGAPASVSVSCRIYVDDVLNVVATSSGTSVVAATVPTEFTADPRADMDVCMTIDFLSDDTPTYDECFAETSEEIPSSEPWRATYEILGTVPGGQEALCAAALTADPLLPGVWRVFGLSEDGDVVIGGKSNGWSTCPGS